MTKGGLKMKDNIQNVYIEVSKLGVFPAIRLKNDPDVYLTKHTMTRLAIIYSNSISCDSTIEKDRFILENPLKKQVLELTSIENLDSEVVKLESNWVYEIISEEKYQKKYKQQTQKFRELFNEKVNEIVRHINNLEGRTKGLLYYEEATPGDLISLKMDIDEIKSKVEDFKL